MQLKLTTLTPVHIGMGQDFDPTGYVIDDGLLYHFDPAAMSLDEGDRRALLACTKQPGADAILAIQRFFLERKELCKAASRIVVPVAYGVAVQYRECVGGVKQRRFSNTDINQLVVERTVHHPYTGVPYLPGTSVKGSIRTAWLDKVNSGHSLLDSEQRLKERQQSPAMERRLLDNGHFKTDPFRLLSISDASGPDVASQVYFSTNHKKRPVMRDGNELPAQGPVARRECIAPAQYGSLSLSVAIDSLLGRFERGDTPTPQARLGSWSAVANACNAFYLPRLRSELALLASRSFSTPSWIESVQNLLKDLEPALTAGTAVILRLGRHSGAESVTLDGVRSIRIMKGRGQPAETGRESTTVWLAAAAADSRSDMLPFGWVVAHAADLKLDALHHWCADQPRIDLDEIRRQVSAGREQAQLRAQEAREAEARRLLEIKLANEAAEREAARVAAMSEQGKAVEALKTQLLAYTATKKQAISGQLYQAVRKSISSAEAGGWSDVDRIALAEVLESVVPTKIDLAGKKKEINQAAERLRQPAQ
ncbi:MAG: RAMP superfamily CRISPR-associated protein [Burkholderiales bacterium]|nr:RAMP superfamily CRISPR-associated protein [Burkholderiales bacterium]